MDEPERRTARIEVLVEPSLKKKAREYALSKDRPLSDMLRQALITSTKWEAPDAV